MSNADRDALGRGRLRRLIVVPYRHQHIHFRVIAPDTSIREVGWRDGKT